MKKFFRKIIFGGIILYLFAILVLLLTNWWIARGDHFSIPKEKTALVLGHSHTGCAIDDEIVNRAFNVAQNTEGYPYSYYKAKILLENNPHIEQVFVEFTNNQFTNFAKNRIWGDYITENLPRTLPVVDFEFAASSFIKNKNPHKITHTLFTGIQKNLRFIVYEDNYVNFLWREYRTPSRKYDGKDRIFRALDSVDPPIEYQQNVEYLLKLKKLCEQSGVKLYLMRSPFPRGTQFENEARFLNYRKSDFEDVPFLDFKDFPLPDSLFADNIHLNTMGRKEFSGFFNSLIDKRGLQFDDIEQKIATAIENYKSNKQ